MRTEMIYVASLTSMIRFVAFDGENGVDLTGTKGWYVEPRWKTVLYCTGSKVAVLARVQAGMKRCAGFLVELQDDAGALPNPPGTSAFTAAGWPGTFYPQGMKAADYLSHYATRFDTVEVDSTFYGAPKAQAVSNWALRTPPGFIFSVKIPRTITHEKILLDCDDEFHQFVDTMKILGEKLGPMVFSVPIFR